MKITTNNSLTKLVQLINDTFHIWAESLQQATADMVNTKPSINDTTPSDTTVYSSNKIDKIVDDLNLNHDLKTITLGTSWVDGLQTVSVPGITENDSPILDVQLGEDIDTILEQQTEWNKIVQATTGNGTITFLSSEDTTIELTILVKGK